MLPLNYGMVMIVNDTYTAYGLLCPRIAVPVRHVDPGNIANAIGVKLVILHYMLLQI